jgi:biotin synthase
VGEEIHLRGIVEFSNICVQNCLYCGLRRDNQNLRRYRMTPGEVLESAKKVQTVGIRTLVLQSGEDPWYTQNRLSNLIRRIKEETGLTLTLSVGERPREDYLAWKEVGADRYLSKAGNQRRTSLCPSPARAYPGGEVGVAAVFEGPGV